MKTLDEYNKEQEEARTALRERLQRSGMHRAGVACNQCGAEMEYTNPTNMLLSLPPKHEVVCPACGARGYKDVV